MASVATPEPATDRRASWPLAAVTELVVPETARARWEIRGFSLLDATKGVSKESPVIVEVAGARFFIQIYIGGSESCNDGTFSLFGCRERTEAPAAVPVIARVKLVVVDQDRDSFTGIVRDQRNEGSEDLRHHTFKPGGHAWFGWPSFAPVEELKRCVKDDTLIVGLEVSVWASGQQHEWRLPAAPGSPGGAVAAGAGDQKRAALAKDFATAFASAESADVEVRGSLCQAGDQPVKAHRFVLAARSPVFKGMLESGMRESQAGASISLEGADREIAEKFVRFLYTDELDQESLEDQNVLCHLLSLGHRFDVQSLVQLCSDRVTITEETAIDRLVMAEQLGLATLKEQAMSFVCSCRKRLAQLQKTEAFARMAKSQPQLMMELLAAQLQ